MKPRIFRAQRQVFKSYSSGEEDKHGTCQADLVGSNQCPFVTLLLS